MGSRRNATATAVEKHGIIPKRHSRAGAANPSRRPCPVFAQKNSLHSGTKRNPAAHGPGFEVLLNLKHHSLYKYFIGQGDRMGALCIVGLTQHKTIAAF
jgi:hypothetical protein